MKTKLLFTILALCCFTIGFSQADCANALPITPGTPQAGDTTGQAGSFSDSNTAPEVNPCSTLYNDLEYWFSYTATANGETLDISVSDLTTNYYGVFVIDNCPDSTPTCIASDTNGFSSADLAVTTPALTAGTTYYIVISDWAEGSTTFTMSSTVIAAPTCLDPTMLAANSITTSSAELSWTEAGSASLYNIELVDITAGDSATGVATDTGVGNPFMQMGLVDNNDYQYYVQADCGMTDGVSEWVGPFSFSTPCSVFVPDYTESFDSSVAPDCWVEAGSGNPMTGPADFGSGLWNHDEFANIGSTNNAAQINLYTTNREDWLISPTFDLSAGGYELVYTVAVTDFANSNVPEGSGMGSDDEVQVLISTDNGANWINLTTYNQSSFPSETGDVETFDLSAYTGNAQFAIWATDGTVDDSEDYDFFFDEFIVRTPLVCTVAVVDSSTVSDDCGNSQFFVDVDITTVGDATQINDGTNTYAISGTGVLQVGPFAEGTTVTLTVEHSDVACNFSLGDFTYLCPPSNDECDAAIALTVNPDLDNGTVTAGTTTGATASSQTDDVSGTPNTDVWYSFVATNEEHRVELLNVVNQGGGTSTSTDMGMGVYDSTAGCEALVLTATSDPNTLNLTGLTIGTTYVVRVYGWFTSIQYNNFDISVGTPPPPPPAPANDECDDAVALTVNLDYDNTVVTAGTTNGATASSQADDVSGTPNTDVWFTFQAIYDEHRVQLLNVVNQGGGTSTSTDMGMGVYDATGGCGALTLTATSDPNTLNLTGLTPGTTYAVRVYGWFTSVQYNNFDVSVGSDPALSTNEFDNPSAFTYYPNPVKNTLTLSAQNTIDNVTMYNMLGQEVLRATPNAVDSDLDMSSLQTGTYFVQVTIANITKTVRVIKQ
ncbi:T9SS type A sorting domain-containing protein [Winogradskyella sp. PE311]|uniref:T9SS type A sorting domain-containing protein n=1 Tax=Winogradskyella sp. PE311 TaxID=3366943 RepID=UPI00397F7E67